MLRPELEPPMTPRSTHAHGAHRKTTQAAPADIARFLQETLGTGLLAHITAVDRKTIARWIAGESTPRREKEERLRAAFQVFHLLQARDAAPTVRAWFIGLNPQLDDESPSEALRQGKLREVLVAAKSFVRGG